jgi:hypothetical protein
MAFVGSIMQPINQAVCPLAPSENQVDEGYVWDVLGDQSRRSARAAARNQWLPSRASL